MDKEQLNKAVNHLQTKSATSTQANLTSIVVNFEEKSIIANPLEFKMQIMDLSTSTLAEITLKHKPKSLRAIAKVNIEMCIDAISLFIADVQAFFITKSPMGKEQIKEVAMLIYSEYKHYNLYDIGVCFKQGKAGKFGKVYDRLDGGVLFSWLTAYDKSRTASIVNIRRNEDLGHKQGFAERSSQITYKKFLQE